MILSRRWLAELLVLAAAILVLGALGPFGSYAAPLGRRLLAWALFLAAGYIFFRPVIAAGTALASQSGLPRLIAIAIACLFGAFPTSLVVALVSAGFAWRGMTAGDLAAIYAKVLIVGATITIVQLLAGRERDGEGASSRPSTSAQIPPAEPAIDLSEAAEGEAAAPSPQAVTQPGPERPPALLDLLPPRLGTEILCLENEDHYVRVHTALGNALILMRMRDAAAQLDGRGERVHRSWWVARDAVVALLRQDRNLRLRLSDGREVPVARASVATLREKGWLQGLPVTD